MQIDECERITDWHQFVIDFKQELINATRIDRICF